MKKNKKNNFLIFIRNRNKKERINKSKLEYRIRHVI